LVTHIRRRRVFAAFAAVTALLLALPTRPQEKNSAPVFRATTRVVNLNVVATDAAGNPVKDLSKDDFTILDGGQPQKITLFASVDNAQLHPAPTIAPDVYVNNLSLKGATPSVTILLFDTLNSRWASQGNGLRQVRNYLRHIEPKDHLGIYVLGEKLTEVYSFTRDASGLLAALNHYDEKNSPASSTSAPAANSTPATQQDAPDPLLESFLSGEVNRDFALEPGDNKRGDARERQQFAIQMTTASLQAIARQLSTVQGRKTLIWVTDSVGPMRYFSDDDLDDYLASWRGQCGVNVNTGPAYENGPETESMIRLMNVAGISVYLISAEGLQSENLAFNSNANAPPVTSPVPMIGEGHLAMLEIAKRTGGRAFYNRNDLDTGIRRALDDSRFTYTLAYAPDHNKWKGEWRKIQVKVNRPGVTVLTRDGYFAMPDPRLISPKDRLEFLSQLAAIPIDSVQLPLAVRIAASSSADGPELDATVHVSPQSMLSSAANGHWAGHIEVMFIQLGEKNKLLDATQKDVDIDLTPDKYTSMVNNGFNLPVKLPLKPGATILSIILHDKNTDDVGSVRIPLARYTAALATH
jgi:VWFA-related protein